MQAAAVPGEVPGHRNLRQLGRASRSAAIALGALLLFLVQPMAGKLLLPGFGGAPAVWTTCLLFFQALLVAGYLYAHLAGRLRSRRVQAIVHGALLAATLFVPFPGPEAFRPPDGASPTGTILILLGRGIGLPYLVLSATSPLLQKWASVAEPGARPYRLYALSNLGSLAALAAYPLLLEPHLGLGAQTRLWVWEYRAFALLSAAAAIAFAAGRGGAGSEPAGVRALRAVPPGERIFWGALAAASSILLVATTHQLCQDVAVVPLLWVLPLALYLVSFVLCFEFDRLYARVPFGIALAATAVQSTVVLFRGVTVPLAWQAASYAATLAVACLVCHGELARGRPPACELTGYYLAIAIGGAAGGAFCTLAAPWLFPGYWEYPAGLGLVCLLALAAWFRDPASRLRGGRPLWAWALLYSGAAALGIALVVQASEAWTDSVAVARNFYGVLRVLDAERENPPRRRTTLMNGRIEHGFQFRDAEKRYWPTSYYGPRSGIGIAVRLHPRRVRREPLRVGVVGLGAGTIATYGEAGDLFRFYEINPEVARLADRYFSYTRLTDARVEIALGDARLGLERERRAGRPMAFDILAVDAFSGDAIPVHLLTRECFEIYRHHLDRDGILAVHISSRYLDLRPVVRGLAETEAAEGVRALWVVSEGSPNEGTNTSDWVLVTRNPDFLASGEVASAVTPWPAGSKAPLVWTDDYSNLLGILQR